MNDLDIDLINLPKWPQLVVKGLPVTKDQAAEILIRTANPYFSSNEKEYENKLYTIIGKLINYEYNPDDGWNAHWKFIEEANLYSQLNLLELDYLNNSRIVSCWVGGPKGWVNWDGTVGCCNYNIGKWPSARVVLVEWQRIAKAFPYLDLTCQLMSNESCENVASIPLIEYQLKDGEVIFKQPTEKLISNVPFVDSFDVFMANNRNEIGCSLQQFESAVKLVLNNI